MAAAATMAGLISNVRPLEDPWRPLKLRLEEEALIWLPCNLSGFMAKHIEQPGSRHSNPAAKKTLCNPSASASRLTSSDPGTTKAFTPAATLRPWATLAASRRSLRRPLVQLPIKQTSTLVPAIAAPGSKFI